MIADRHWIVDDDFEGLRPAGRLGRHVLLNRRRALVVEVHAGFDERTPEAQAKEADAARDSQAETAAATA